MSSGLMPPGVKAVSGRLPKNAASESGESRSEYSGAFAIPSIAYAFIRKDLAIAVSYKLQFVFQFSQVFFGITVIYFIGKMLETGNPSPLLSKYGADYFSFALVGMAVNNYMKVGIVTVTNNLRQDMNQGILEAMCATPVRYWLLLLYSALWPFVFQTFQIGIYFLLGYTIFGLRLPHANWWAGAVSLTLIIPIFLMLGVISCSVLILVKRGDPVNWFFSSASGILAGTMFPVSVFPKWLRVIAMCLPLTHSMEAMRMCLLQGSSLLEIKGNILALLGFALCLAPLTILVNTICMNQARKQGSFAAF